MTELAIHQPATPALSEQMHYADVISRAGMLPQAYRGKPADILLAMGLGQSMGLSPAESLLRIHVIQGRPTASAELIAANVRRAGHRLRVTGDETSARAVIVRSDDPDFEYEAVWTIDRARKMGLLDKDGWKKQPGTMMRWRAITEVARLACSEALYGVQYVAEEVEDTRPTAAVKPRGMDAIREAVKPVETVEVVDEPDAETGEAITPQQSKALHAAFTRAGVTDRDARLDYCRNLIGRDVETSNELTKREASRVIDALNQDAQDAPGLIEVPGE